MTKIMTAIVALEAFQIWTGRLTLSEDIFYALDGQDATQAGFQPGESVRIRDLVYGVILPSGAECCLALANEVSGAEADFVEKMNAKAKSIDEEHPFRGLLRPYGIPGPLHYGQGHRHYEPRAD